jgi:ferredoxin
MTTAIIVGSGAAAAGAAIALNRRENLNVIVVDIGLQLETERRQLVSTLSSFPPDEWDVETIQDISRQPVVSTTKGIPEKRVFGSDYPFRNAGQLEGVTAVDGAVAPLISSAYGGFSNVWGSQIMPFTESTFESWPINAATMRRHYESILNCIPFAGEEDDLALSFPLMRSPAPLPSMSPRSIRVLKSYERHRSKINDQGIILGKARLAFSPKECMRCGMCMTGCPYGLIYSAAQTFDQLRRDRKVTFHDGYLALKITEDADQAIVIAKELSTGQLRRFAGDRIYVACGAIGSTRLIANSIGLFGVDLPMLESRQFILPFVSLRAIKDPRSERSFTLNQFNMIVSPDGGGLDISTLHFYTFNRAFIDALPTALRVGPTQWLQAQLLRRLTVAFGYLPSWKSPRLQVRVGSELASLDLPEIRISGETPPEEQNRMLRALLRRITRSAQPLDLYPIIPMFRLSAVGKSYHWGGSFPHAIDRSTVLSSDSLGRVAPLTRTHLVDASVFPTVPATTYGLTVMANAHRIASESLELTP